MTSLLLIGCSLFLSNPVKFEGLDLRIVNYAIASNYDAETLGELLWQFNGRQLSEKEKASLHSISEILADFSNELIAQIRVTQEQKEMFFWLNHDDVLSP